MKILCIDLLLQREDQKLKTLKNKITKTWQSSIPIHDETFNASSWKMKASTRERAHLWSSPGSWRGCKASAIVCGWVARPDKTPKRRETRTQLSAPSSAVLSLLSPTNNKGVNALFYVHVPCSVFTCLKIQGCICFQG